MSDANRPTRPARRFSDPGRARGVDPGLELAAILRGAVDTLDDLEADLATRDRTFGPDPALEMIEGVRAACDLARESLERPGTSEIDLAEALSRALAIARARRPRGVTIRDHVGAPARIAARPVELVRALAASLVRACEIAAGCEHAEVRVRTRTGARKAHVFVETFAPGARLDRGTAPFESVPGSRTHAVSEGCDVVVLDLPLAPEAPC